MGLLSLFSGLLDGGDEGEATDAGRLDMVVDVERRAGSIASHYDLSGDLGRRVAEILAAEVARDDGYARQLIADRLERELDLDPELATSIVATEVASVRNLARVRKFTRLDGEDVRFRWVDSAGTDDSPVCAGVRARIDERGAVQRPELEAIIREVASEYDDGTPDRAADLIPHDRCGHTVVRHFGE